MSRRIGFTATLRFALAAAAGDHARTELLNTATEDDINELRRAVLAQATSDETHTAEFTRTRIGSDLTVLCGIALRHDPVAIIPGSLVARLLQFLRSINAHYDLANAPENVASLLLALERATQPPAPPDPEPSISARIRAIAALNESESKTTALIQIAEEVEDIAAGMRGTVSYAGPDLDANEVMLLDTAALLWEAPQTTVQAP